MIGDPVMPEPQRFIADQIPARSCVGYAVKLWLWKLTCDIAWGGEVGMCHITTKRGEVEISSNQSGDQLGDNKRIMPKFSGSSTLH
jgi:hypothetical protein